MPSRINDPTNPIGSIKVPITLPAVVVNIGNEVVELKAQDANRTATLETWKKDALASMVSTVNTVEFAKQESVIKAIAPLVLDYILQDPATVETLRKKLAAKPLQ